MRIATSPLKNSDINYLQSLHEVIDESPDYQREGDIWNQDAKQLLIDSIINGFDVPKLYFQSLTSSKYTPDGRRYQYALIDGKQRLGAILDFLNDKYPLDEKFKLYRDENATLGGKTFSELVNEYPLVASEILGFRLNVMVVKADNVDLVEEMFQRLNASSTLTAAEYRNAIGGPARAAVASVIASSFFDEKMPIKNSRYRYREFGVKFLSICRQMTESGRLIDTKKARLDDFFRDAKNNDSRETAVTAEELESYIAETKLVLAGMSDVFQDEDHLLSSVGSVVVYFILFKRRIKAETTLPSREALSEFESMRKTVPSETDDVTDPPGFGTLRAYNTFVQSVNDGNPLTKRAAILDAFDSAYQRGADPMEAVDGMDLGEL